MWATVAMQLSTLYTMANHNTYPAQDTKFVVHWEGLLSLKSGLKNMRNALRALFNVAIQKGLLAYF